MLPDIPPLMIDALAHLAGDGSGIPALDDDLEGLTPSVPSSAPARDAMVGPRDDNPETVTEETAPDTGQTAISHRAEWSGSDGEERFDTGSNTSLVQNVVRTTPDRRMVPVRTTSQSPHPHHRQRRSGELGPLIPRDREALLLLTRLRLASMQQLAELAYPSASLVVARRRLRRLRDNGWITFWDRPTTTGAAIRYAVPTPRALAWANETFAQEYAARPAATLMQRMLPVRTRRLSELVSGVIPPWFAHQDEINRLLIAIARAETDRPTWFSSWDCPFPDRVNGLKAPQPDYVLLRPAPTSVRVTFGEHDRATEGGSEWAEKLASYAAAQELAQTWLGIDGFTIDVTVIDASPRNPIERLRRLIDLARGAGMHNVTRFTLAGWLHAFPGQAVWFVNGAMPATESCARADHLEHLRA